MAFASTLRPASRVPLMPRFVALVLGALAVGSVAYWGLRLVGTGVSADGVSPVSAAAPARVPEAADPTLVGRLLSPAAQATPRAAAAASGSRWVLTGVVAGVSGRGAALVAVDGQPPRAYTVGTPVADGLVLQSVEGRRASFGASARGPATLTLELPPLPR